MNNKKSNLDEYQEQKLLHIGNFAYALAFYGLILAVAVQLALDMGDKIYGELIVLFVLGLYIVGACLKHGIWERRLRADSKTNFWISIATGFACGIFWFAKSYITYHKILGSVATGVFVCIFTFLPTFLLLSLLLKLYQKRVKKLEQEEDEQQ